MNDSDSHKILSPKSLVFGGYLSTVTLKLYIHPCPFVNWTTCKPGPNGAPGNGFGAFGTFVPGQPVSSSQINTKVSLSGTTIAGNT